MKDQTPKEPSIKQPSVKGTANTAHLGQSGSDQALQQGHTKVAPQSSDPMNSGKEKKIIQERMKLQAHNAERQIQSGGDSTDTGVFNPPPVEAKASNKVSKQLNSMAKTGSAKKRS
jgi:hypothetical protein